ncbi:B12-binding domain-containing radical SAM protein [bacterium]|nr:B12-binding domain-containing radical SAM protein [bacterium]MBU1917161.1 B12-binding domain-containing radical SAM protein [bacterium]
MNVLLIYPDFPEEELGGCFYTGVASIYASVKKAGHKIQFYHMTKLPSDKAFEQDYLSERPDVVAFSSCTPMFKYAQRFLKLVKEHNPSIFTVVGGAHGRMACDDAIQSPYVDAVCAGEGEFSFVELLSRLQAKETYWDVKNFAFKKDGQIIKNQLEVIETLNDIPDPDREIFNYKTLYEYSKGGRAKVATFMFSRGCPFNCAYCCNERMKRDYKHQKKVYVRYVDPVRIVQQIKNHIKKHPETEYVRFDDSNINLDKNIFRRFIAEYKKHISLPFSCHARPNLVDEETVRSLKEAGCFLIMMGLEHGDAKFRADVLRRPMSDVILKRAYDLCHKYEIPVRSFAMTGLPFETLRLAVKTMKTAALLGTYDLSNSIFYPYPYTELKATCDTNDFKVSSKRFEVGPLNFALPLKQPTIKEKEVILVSKLAHIWLFLFVLARKVPLIGRALCSLIALFVFVFSKVYPEVLMTKSIMNMLNKLDLRINLFYKNTLYRKYTKKNGLLLGI